MCISVVGISSTHTPPHCYAAILFSHTRSWAYLSKSWQQTGWQCWAGLAGWLAGCLQSGECVWLQGGSRPRHRSCLAFQFHLAPAVKLTTGYAATALFLDHILQVRWGLFYMCGGKKKEGRTSEAKRVGGWGGGVIFHSAEPRIVQNFS